jgi:hypothetical protein
MRHRNLLICIIAACAVMYAGGAFAAVKTIYIKPFAIMDGFKKTDPVGNLVKDYVSEYIIESGRGKYSIISDDEVKQVLAQEELRMSLDACYDDACMKQLMKSIKTDYMIFGTVSLTAGKYIVTIKLLDRSGGDVRVGKVKTIEFKNRLRLKMASKDLAAYVINNKAIDMENYMEQEEVEALKQKAVAPKGLAFSYRFFMPLTAPLKKYGKFFHGGALDYTGALGKSVSLFGGGTFLYGTGKSGTSVSMTPLGLGLNGSSKIVSYINSYYFGAKFGYLVSEYFYPYVGLALKGTWFRYTFKGSAHDYAGVGADGSAGFAFTIERKVSLFIEFQGGWGMLLDKGKTDMSGIGAAGGLMINF